MDCRTQPAIIGHTLILSLASTSISVRIELAPNNTIASLLSIGRRREILKTACIGLFLIDYFLSLLIKSKYAQLEQLTRKYVTYQYDCLFLIMSLFLFVIKP